jgi:hypothetical protein
LHRAICKISAAKDDLEGPVNFTEITNYEKERPLLGIYDRSSLGWDKKQLDPTAINGAYRFPKAKGKGDMLADLNVAYV